MCDVLQVTAGGGRVWCSDHPLCPEVSASADTLFPGAGGAFGSTEEAVVEKWATLTSARLQILAKRRNELLDALLGAGRRISRENCRAGTSRRTMGTYWHDPDAGLHRAAAVWAGITLLEELRFSLKHKLCCLLALKQEACGFGVDRGG